MGEQSRDRDSGTRVMQDEDTQTRERDSTSRVTPPNVNGQPVDFSASSGAVDTMDATRDADTQVNEEISERETSFEPKEGKGNVDWSTLDRYDQGVLGNSSKRRTQKRKGHRRRDRQHMAHLLDMDEYLPLVEAIMDEIELNDFSPHPHETVALGAFTYAANHHDFDIRKKSIHADERYVDAFVELREINGVSRGDIKAVREKLPTVREALSP